jgi:hypothetical protein
MKSRSGSKLEGHKKATEYGKVSQRAHAKKKARQKKMRAS